MAVGMRVLRQTGHGMCIVDGLLNVLARTGELGKHRMFCGRGVPGLVVCCPRWGAA
ncbi:hypothetical protein JOF56_001559 [Kibdelosporangium banguiense]|uniref:Uncharacterized protein n=1 Tax=Kibdelosporangium banguiense TaxID=1365924 RepID=A0ABS4TB16_9PSEU|nr:hypothetical protein [Kibdelosporangium banguiense]MBP2321174.1 hypothetical protein [Kibdelosporangium banguiense]